MNEETGGLLNTLNYTQNRLACQGRFSPFLPVGRIILFLTCYSSSVGMAGFDPAHLFRRFDSGDIQVDDDRVLPASDDHALQRLVRAGVDLLMGHKRRHIDEAPGSASAINSSAAPQRIRARPFTT